MRDNQVGDVLDINVPELQPGDHIINTDFDVVGVVCVPGCVPMVRLRTDAGHETSIPVQFETLQVFRPSPV